MYLPSGCEDSFIEQDNIKLLAHSLNVSFLSSFWPFPGRSGSKPRVVGPAHSDVLWPLALHCDLKGPGWLLSVRQGS